MSPNSYPSVHPTRPKLQYKNSLKQLNPGMGKAGVLHLYPLNLYSALSYLCSVP